MLIGQGFTENEEGNGGGGDSPARVFLLLFNRLLHILCKGLWSMCRGCGSGCSAPTLCAGEGACFLLCPEASGVCPWIYLPDGAQADLEMSKKVMDLVIHWFIKLSLVEEKVMRWWPMKWHPSASKTLTDGNLKKWNHWYIIGVKGPPRNIWSRHLSVKSQRRKSAFSLFEGTNKACWRPSSFPRGQGWAHVGEGGAKAASGVHLMFLLHRD